MDLKENWRAWQSSLEGAAGAVCQWSAVVSVADMEASSREVSGRLLHLGLLFGEEPCERDDVGVHLRDTVWRPVAVEIKSGHVVEYGAGFDESGGWRTTHTAGTMIEGLDDPSSRTTSKSRTMYHKFHVRRRYQCGEGLRVEPAAWS